MLRADGTKLLIEKKSETDSRSTRRVRCCRLPATDAEIERRFDLGPAADTAATGTLRALLDAAAVCIRPELPLANVRDNPEHLALLESWLRSYHPEQLFDANGRFIEELARLVPIVHTATAVERWVDGLLAIHGCVAVARLNSVLVGFLVTSREGNLNWIDQLYIAPGHTGGGIGRELLAHALRVLGRAYPVRLYTFQANTGARRFYERAGFWTVALTDGAGNEERCPDVLFELEALPKEMRRRD